MTTTPDPAAVETLERIADNAWPAATRERLGGWILNADAGYSGRLNACWPLGEPPVDESLESAVEAVELWYGRNGLPPLFKIAGENPALTDLLRARGYHARTPTLVMTGPLIQDALPEQVVLSEQASGDFEAVFLGTQGDPADAAERMAAFRRIPAPRFFASIERAGAPVAIGAGCAAGGQVGLFGMRTLASHRRQGLAAAILRALLIAGGSAGAQGAYLQVEAGNDPAVNLYRRFGFAPAYRYVYWARA